MYSSSGGRHECVRSLESCRSAAGGSGSGPQPLWPLLQLETGTGATVTADAASLPGARFFHRTCCCNDGRVLFVLHHCTARVGRLEPCGIERFPYILAFPTGHPALRV